MNILARAYALREGAAPSERDIRRTVQEFQTALDLLRKTDPRARRAALRKLVMGDDFLAAAAAAAPTGHGAR